MPTKDSSAEERFRSPDTLTHALQPGADTQVAVLFLTGQPGAGKTAVAKEISELFWQIREPHAVIDLDELCRGRLPDQTPNVNRSLTVVNLSGVWTNFYAAGVRRLILARIIETPDDLAQFRSAIPNAQITVCHLHTPAPMIQQRITEREPGSARTFYSSSPALLPNG